MLFFLQDGDFTLQIKNYLEMCWHETLIQAELQGTSDVMCPYFWETRYLYLKDTPTPSPA